MIIFQKKIYRDCAILTVPEQVAAFKASIFLHSFIRAFKLNKDSPTFLGDQRLQLALYDAKKTLPVTRTVHEIAAPARGPSEVIPAAPPRPLSPSPLAIAGPGPQTMANFARPGENRLPFSKRLSVSPPPRTTGTTLLPSRAELPNKRKKDPKEVKKVYKGFRDIEESGSESEKEEHSESKMAEPRRTESRPIVPEKKGKEKKTADEKPCANEKVIKVKRRRTAAATPQPETAESDSSSSTSWDEMRQKSKPRTTPAKSKLENKKNENPVVPTGELYDPPCSTCRIAERDCEKQGLGSACVACRRSKQRCEYSLRKRRAAKSKDEVDSEDDQSDGPTEDPASRKAAKDASKAITKAIENIETATAPTKKKAARKSKGMCVLK